MSTLVLNKYQVNYFKCQSCEFIQTDEPYWLNEAYSSAITSLDIGLIYRNVLNVPIVETIIKLFFNKKAKYVDYGGGYGMFVRMMRDKGFDFFRQDIYCENLFAKNFDVNDLPGKEKFELLTAFEVFEHLVDPIKEINKMFEYSENIFFTTSIYPQNSNLLDWWYLIPETGQHVSLYSIKSLEYISRKNNLFFYSFNNTHHLFSKRKISGTLFQWAFNQRFQKIYNRFSKNPASLLGSDYNKIAGIKM